MKCTKCKWYKNEYDINLVTYDGNDSAEIIFLGEAYGKSEAKRHKKTGEPKCFVGDAGKKYEELLKYADLSRKDVITMNSVRCYQKGNPTPTKKELDTCFIYSYRDIQILKPKLVVAMGGTALYQATGRKGITDNRGRLIYSEKLQCNVYPTFHPAACLYDDTKWLDLVEDFKRIPSLINSDPDPIKHYDYFYVDTPSKFDSIFEELAKAKYLYTDLETTGLDPWTDKIVLIQIGISPDDIFVIDGGLIENVENNEVVSKLQWLFKTKIFVGQAYAFDAKFIAVHLDVFPYYWGHDSCLYEFILSGVKDNNLTFLTGKYARESFGYDEPIKLLGGAHKVKDFKQLRQYAADDIGVLFPIIRKQYKQMCKENTEWLATNITVPCNRVLTKMSIRGVKYDFDALWKADKKYKDMADKAMEKALKLDAVQATQNHFKDIFNPRSSIHIKWMMIEHYKVPIIKKTGKGNPSIGRKEMEEYAKLGNEYAQIMEMYRSYQQIRSTNLSGVIEHLKDGIAHTNYSLHAAATGRPASSNPNLQNIPRDDDIKRMFVARDGYTFLYADLSQIEVRVAAMLSQDKALMDACNSAGSDFHSKIACKINGMQYQEFYDLVEAGDKAIKEIRNKAKTTTFGVLYGMSKYGLAYRLGITEDEAQDFIDDYFGEFPQLKRYMDSIEDFVIENGFIDTYFGFRRRWKNHTPDDHNTIREAQNHPIQGTAWNLMQLILIKLDKLIENMKSGLVMQTYDSVVIEAKNDEMRLIVPEMKEIMTTIHLPFKQLNTVKVLTDIEAGPNLRDLEKWKDG